MSTAAEDSVFAREWESYADGRRAMRGSLMHDELSKQLRDYKRKVAKRYRVVFPESIKKFLPDGDDLYVSTKIDGELWFLVKRDGELALCAYNGRVIQGLPLLEEASEQLDGVDDITVPGELFAIPPEGDSRPRVGHVAQALHDEELAPTLGFRAFDLIDEGDKEWGMEGFGERYERLEELFDGGERCAVMTTLQGDRETVQTHYREWVDSGKFEGLVVRTASGITYKIKPRLTIDAVVVAFGERVVDDQTEIRELTVALERDDGSFQLLGSVGTGLDQSQRVEWHERLSEMEVDSEYRLANREGTLCRFVRPEIVVELKISDLVSTDARARPVRRMTLDYDGDDGFRPLGPMPFVSMLHPTLVRERDDKEVDPQNVGLDQVFQHVRFDARGEEAEATQLPETEIIERRVFSKELRGDNLGVRKYVAFATNKEDVSDEWAPYGVHFTDFSSGRESPLKTDLRVASSEEGLQEHIDAWIDDNIKRGWEEVE
jgi:ATP-dependent DNA ligase